MTKRAVMIPMVVLGIAVGLFFIIRSHWTKGESGAGVQKTDDAYVRADQTPLSTRISGTVRRVTVGDYQSVKAGQLLVELDDADYQAMLKEAEAALDAAKAEYAGNQDAKRAADASIAAAQSGIEQAEAAVAAARAGINATQANVAQAESEFARQQALLSNKAATKQQFEQAQASKLSVVAGLQGHQADLAKAQAAVASAQAALAGAKQQRSGLDCEGRRSARSDRGQKGSDYRSQGQSELHQNLRSLRRLRWRVPCSSWATGRCWRAGRQPGAKRDLDSGKLQRDSTRPSAPGRQR